MYSSSCKNHESSGHPEAKFRNEEGERSFILSEINLKSGWQVF